MTESLRERVEVVKGDPSTGCLGGFTFEDCPAAQEMSQTIGEMLLHEINTYGRPTAWKTFDSTERISAGKALQGQGLAERMICKLCAVPCSLAVEVDDKGEKTGQEKLIVFLPKEET